MRAAGQPSAYVRKVKVRKFAQGARWCLWAWNEFALNVPYDPRNWAAWVAKIFYDDAT